MNRGATRRMVLSFAPGKPVASSRLIRGSPCNHAGNVASSYNTNHDDHSNASNTIVKRREFVDKREHSQLGGRTVSPCCEALKDLFWLGFRADRTEVSSIMDGRKRRSLRLRASRLGSFSERPIAGHRS